MAAASHVSSQFMCLIERRIQYRPKIAQPNNPRMFHEPLSKSFISGPEDAAVNIPTNAQ